MIRFVPWSEVGTIEVSPGDDLVEVGEFELDEGADTLWVRMTNTGTPGPWPWSYGILSFKTEEGQPLGSIKAYNSFEGEVFRLGVGLAPSVRSGVLTFEPRGFNMAWINQGNPWELKFEAQSGGGTVSSGYWNRDPENGLITPKTSGDNLDMTPGWIKAKNLILTDGTGSPVEKEVPGYLEGTWTPTSSGVLDYAYGHFVRVENQVTAHFGLKFGAMSGTNTVTNGGLPFDRVSDPNADLDLLYRDGGWISFSTYPNGLSPYMTGIGLNDWEYRLTESVNSRLNWNQATGITCIGALVYVTSDTTWQPT